MYNIYWLINERKNKTYLGFTNNLKQRIYQHKNKKVKSTKDFGKFRCIILEHMSNLELAIKREGYWKSGAGRKKLKILFKKLIEKDKK